MSFSNKIKEEVLVASARHCCVCHRFKGVKIEVHHIIPKSDGGKDTLENAIPLCFDCHCDAGHYNPNHPKGTKFSQKELKKHKQHWFEIVRTNKIKPKKVNRLHARYLITDNFKVMKEFSKHNLSKFPINNIISHPNSSIEFFSSIFRGQDYRQSEIQETINSRNHIEYSEKYPNAVEFSNEGGDYKRFYHKRIPSSKEIYDCCGSDGLTRFLLNNDVPSDKISRVLTFYDDDPCAGIGDFKELFLLRPLYFKFIVLTNISDDYIKLGELKCKTKDGILYGGQEINSEEVITFPPIQIIPNQSVIIPLGMFLSDFERLKKENIGFTKQEEPKQGLTTYLDHISASYNHEMEYLGRNYNPLEILYEVSGMKEVEEFHEFNFNNLYWLDTSWAYGSCPHLFNQLTSGDLKYQGELFNKSPDLVQSHKLRIKKHVEHLIIAELEDEITLIQEIKVNGICKIRDFKLNKGQQIQISVKCYDLVELTGYYSTHTKNTMPMPVYQKHQLVMDFKNKHR